LLAGAALLDRPRAKLPPERRPAPRPPGDARPAELSVTRIELLVRDPYAVYAAKVLGLYPLDPPGRSPDALARGSALHAALDAFVVATADGLPEDAAAELADIVHRTLDEQVPWPAIRAIWAARLIRSGDWFVGTERERRTRARPAVREVRGRRAVEGLARAFAVTATADRIDRTARGGYAIYDYKSGGIPSKREAAAFHLQLPLEAAIAAGGGFEDLAPGSVEHLELIGLNAQKTLPLESDPAAIAEAWARLGELVAYYQAEENAFVARLRPQKITWEGDYDHLARKGEWDDGDELAGAGAP
jgi:RecB family exonuclease